MKLKLLFLIFIVLVGCTLPTLTFDIRYEELWKCVEDSYIDGIMPEREFANVSEVITWAYTHITYARDIDLHGTENYAQTPYETERSREGDCEDFTLHSMYYIYDSLAISRDNIFLITGMLDGKGIHSWVSVNGTWWDPTRGIVADHYVNATGYDAFVRRSYYEVMYLAHVYHRL